MTIESASIKYNGTVAVPADGTATGLLTKGADMVSRATILNDSSEFVSQKAVHFTTKAPKVQPGAPNGYSQARSSVRVSVPLVLANGNRTINTLTLQLACDPETTGAAVTTMLGLGAQLLADSGFAEFWKSQSLS